MDSLAHDQTPPLPPAVHLAERVALLRRVSGLSQRALAQAVGCRPQTIARLEQQPRRSMNLDHLVALARVFTTTVDTLLGSGPVTVSGALPQPTDRRGVPRYPVLRLPPTLTLRDTALEAFPAVKERSLEATQFLGNMGILGNLSWSTINPEQYAHTDLIAFLVQQQDGLETMREACEELLEAIDDLFVLPPEEG